MVPHLGDPELNRIFVQEFNKYTWGRWRKKFTAGHFPDEFESCDWRFDRAKRGPMPRYWRYVKHAACHWIVNFALKLAMLAEPGKPWRIITSDEHSTVWDGGDTLFDFNFLALGISADECFKNAIAGKNNKMMPVGKYLKVYYPAHYNIEA
jgi:hypothetical protein